MIIPVILAGGSGSRLWPLSRAHAPKQFLAINGPQTMLQETVSRIAGLLVSDSIIVCNEEHRFLVAEQLREIDALGKIVLEPFGRNTAPAIALAALSVEYDSLLLVLPADHFLEKTNAFVDTVQGAVPIADSGKLVTFGVVPTEPHIGYGYIEGGSNFGTGFEVVSFTEKPDLETATIYLNAGRFYWNSGIFLFRAGRYLEELKSFRPKMYQFCVESIANASSDLDFIRVDADVFQRCPSESVDYAVMENTSDAAVVPLDVGWNDVGSWTSLWDVGDRDLVGNVAIGDAMLHDTKSSYVWTNGQLVATVGVEGLIIVCTKDAILVAHRDRAQDVKVIADQLKSESRREWEVHREVYRPWGKYESIDNGKQHQVKRITVRPGAKLSVQMHLYRAEHWVVISGVAKVTKGEGTYLLSENQSVYIPIGVKHSLENVGASVLEIIEIQSGSYFGEDDIVRFEDRYGRE